VGFNLEGSLSETAYLGQGPMAEMGLFPATTSLCAVPHDATVVLLAEHVSSCRGNLVVTRPEETVFRWRWLCSLRGSPLACSPGRLSGAAILLTLSCSAGTLLSGGEVIQTAEGDSPVREESVRPFILVVLAADQSEVKSQVASFPLLSARFYSGACVVNFFLFLMVVWWYEQAAVRLAQTGCLRPTISFWNVTDALELRFFLLRSLMEVQVNVCPKTRTKLTRF
jgi:hypothetical protein